LRRQHSIAQRRASPRRTTPTTNLLYLDLPRQPRATLFPYTTLFRSHACLGTVDDGGARRGGRREDARRQTAAAQDSADDAERTGDRKSTRLNSSHRTISYAVFCLKKKSEQEAARAHPPPHSHHSPPR